MREWATERVASGSVVRVAFEGVSLSDRRCAWWERALLGGCAADVPREAAEQQEEHLGGVPRRVGGGRERHRLLVERFDVRPVDPVADPGSAVVVAQPEGALHAAEPGDAARPEVSERRDEVVASRGLVVESDH